MREAILMKACINIAYSTVTAKIYMLYTNSSYKSHNHIYIYICLHFRVQLSAERKVLNGMSYESSAS